MTIKMRRRKFMGPSDSLDLAVTAAYKLFGGENEADEDWDDEEEWDSPVPEEINSIEIFVADKFSPKRRKAKLKLSEQGIFVKCAEFDRVRLHRWDFDPFMWEPYDDGKSE